MCHSFAKQKNDTVFFLAVSDARHARVTMGDSADSDADDPLSRETGADMSRWLSRRDADEVGPDLAPVSVGLTRRKYCVILLRSKRTTQFFSGSFRRRRRHARVTMGDSADSDADDPLFRETGADMSRWLSRRDADEVGPDLAPVPVAKKKLCRSFANQKNDTVFFLAVFDADAGLTLTPLTTTSG